MALYGALAENTRRNERIERGTTASFASGSITITVPPPMRQITAVFLTLQGGSAPGLGTSTLTYTIGTGANSNQFTIFAWMPTSATNPTLIASTAATVVTWQAWGNLSAGQGF